MTPTMSQVEFVVAIVNFQPFTFVLQISTLDDATSVLDCL